MRTNILAWSLGLAILAPQAMATQCQDIESDEERLACYDRRAAQDGGDCTIENLKFSIRGTSVVTMQGTTSCDSGKLTYSVFNAEGDFLAAGFHYFDGYVFEAYPDITPSMAEGEMSLDYTIAPR